MVNVTVVSDSIQVDAQFPETPKSGDWVQPDGADDSWFRVTGVAFSSGNAQQVIVRRETGDCAPRRGRWVFRP